MPTKKFADGEFGTWTEWSSDHDRQHRHTMKTSTRELAELLDRDKIRNCLARLARGEDRRNAELIGGSYWPQAVVDHGVFTGTFHEYLAWVVPGSPDIPVTQHVLGQSVIDLHTDTALVETHVLAYHRVDGGSEHRDTVIGGRYLDWMDKIGAEWRISRRTMIYDWVQGLGSSVDWATGLMGMPFDTDRYTGRAVGDHSEELLQRPLDPRWGRRPRMTSLAGKVAVVTGASRGIGRGIALALGEQGAAVYVTGRTAAVGEHELPGTIGDTASEVTRRGGTGIAVQVDHADDDQVTALFERVRAEQGRLDILVNNAFALPEDLTDPKPFWDKPLSNWEMVDVGVRSNFVAARLAALLMVPQGSGLIVATSGYVGVTYTYGVVFGLCKAAVDRMARDMAIELQPYSVASVSLWQGLTMTERAQRNLAACPEMTQSIVTSPAVGCSPEFPGRVIASLATDPELMDLSGGTYITAELAQRYGITDVDGSTVPSLRAERGSPIWQPIREGGNGH